MAIDEFLSDKATSKYNDIIIEDDNADSTSVFLKSLSEKLDEVVGSSNKATYSSTATGFTLDNVEFAVSTSGRNFILTIKTTLGSSKGNVTKSVALTIA